MIDIKLIRENPAQVKENMKQRGLDEQPVEDVLSLDQKRREIIHETEKLKNLRNVASNEIAKMKKEGKDASAKITAMKKTSDEIKKFDEELAELEKQINTKMLDVPNMMEENVPKGKSEKDNVEVKRWGEKPGGDFKFLDHIQLGKKLDILDFDIGAKITGSGFPFYKGKGAILERALINFMLDTHKQKYTEVFTPFIVNRTSMEVTEKVPKFEEDMYRIDVDDLFAIPTAEVPIINIHRDEILRHDQLPIKYCGYTACFRREAGHYGKETKGFLRVHQFNKVELVNFCKPDKSFTELELMLEDATAIVEALNIHYRVIELCSGDLGFSSAKTYDIEVWSPAEEKFLEASSVSNFTDYQARRAMIRYRPDEPKAKPEFVHILNGSGLATSRLMVSLMESYQTPEGKIIVPKVLHKYTGFEIIG
jgi:seryl-tRNA synthetase